MPEQDLSAEEVLSIRNEYISGSCRLHYVRSPMKIVRSEGQYMFNEHGEKYLDCTSRTSAVGHCHPKVVDAACSQLGKISFIMNSSLEANFSKLMLSTLPERYEVCLFTSSGGEANDLALQLCQRVTGRKGVAVVDGSFHGSVLSLMNTSSKTFRMSPEGRKPWVQVIPCPDKFRGMFLGESEKEIAEAYFQEAVRVLEKAKEDGSPEIGAFICEPILVVPGLIVPPKGWLKKIYRYIQSNGGLVIADEIATGLGRTGSNFWAFQAVGDGALPDIITVGKPIGNGYPLAAVLTTKRVAKVLTSEERQHSYYCGPVEAAVGIGVLKVMEEEKLVENAREVGQYFMENLRVLQSRHSSIGDIRGKGLLIGVDIVRSLRIPAADLAESISYKLRDKGVLVANEGELENVLVFIPPFCVTKTDIDRVIQVFDDILLEVTTDVDILEFIGDLNVNNNSLISRQESPRSSPQLALDYSLLD